MKPVRDVMTTALADARAGRAPAGIQAAAAAPLGVVDAQTADVVEKIFLQLQAIFPAWKQAWPDTQALAMAKRSWTRGLMDAGIRDIEQVRFGIEQCRRSGSAFAPSIGQFVAWCQPTPEMLGLPPANAAYREACRNSHPAAGEPAWSHEAVRHAACEVGMDRIRNLPEEQSRRLFDRAYEISCRHVQAGLPLGKQRQGLEWDGGLPLDVAADRAAEQALQARMRAQGVPQDAEACRQRLRSMFGDRRG